MKLEFKRKQISRSEYEFIQIDVDDEKAVQALKNHNKEVNHQIYMEKKNESIYSIEQVQQKLGHELEDENSNPYKKIELQEEEKIKREKIKCLKSALEVLNEALSTLTETQEFVVKKIVYENLSFSDVAKIRNVDHKAVTKSFDSAIIKLRKFYRKYPEYIKVFPNLNSNQKVRFKNE